nr:hypothetical protein [uncultured Actinoplanes sp.]
MRIPDGKDYGTAPTAGDMTRTDVLGTATSNATTYLTTVNEVNGWGRVKKTTDARNIAATTTYVDVDGFNIQRMAGARDRHRPRHRS